MIKPNYSNGSIANLMSSIAKGFKTHTPYGQLKILKGKELEKGTVILLVIDGLGYNYLMKRPDSFLAKNCKGKMTSCFPSTTSTCVTCFSTGLPAQQSGITGWHIWLKEIATMAAILPLRTRLDWTPINVEPSLIFPFENLYDKIKAKTYVVVGNIIKDSQYSKITNGKATRIGYNTRRSMFSQIKKLCDGKRKYVYAYWPQFDSICHEVSCESIIAEAEFRMIDHKISKLWESIKNKNITLLVTADHGHIWTPTKKRIRVDKMTDFQNCLHIPLSGEPRVAYAHVKPTKETQFKKVFKKKLSKYFTLHKSTEFVKKGYFGKGRAIKELYERIGDYIIIAKPGYSLVDSLLGQEYHGHEGNHGGTEPDEMYIPLVVLQGKKRPTRKKTGQLPKRRKRDK